MFLKHNIFWIIWLVVISYLSNTEPSGLPKLGILQFEHADKLVHAIFYFVLVILCSYGFRKQHVLCFLEKQAIKIAFIFAVCWGAIMELLQLTIFTYRSADWLDFFTNTFGALLGILIVPVFLSLINKKNV